MSDSPFTPVDPNAPGSPDTVANALFGAEPAIDIQSLTLIGGSESISLYDGSLDLGIGAGVLLTTGGIPATRNTSDSAGQDLGLPGDADLSGIVGADTFDASNITITLNNTDPTVTGISFQIQFGTEEFPEYVDQYADVAAVFINGINFALFNHDQDARMKVTSDNVDAGYFNENGDGQYDIEYDGVTGVITIRAPIQLGENTIKIAIADTADHNYDSGLFVSNFQTLVEGDCTGGVTYPDVEEDNSGNNLFTGTNCADDLSGGLGNDILYGLSGDDTMRGDEGDNTLYGGNGADQLIGMAGHTRLYGDAGNDHIVAVDFSSAFGGAGDDLIVLSTEGAPPEIVQQDGLLGGAGDDTLAVAPGAVFDVTSFDAAAAGFEKVEFYTPVEGSESGNAISFGGALTNNADGALTLNGNGGDDTLTGMDDADKGDTINGDAGDDTIYGGLGDDQITGGIGANTLNGGGGNDTIEGTAVLASHIKSDADGLAGVAPSNNTMNGGAGDDLLIGGTGHDVMNGGSDNDTIHADGTGVYTVSGGDGNDTVFFQGAITAPDQLGGGAGGSDALELAGDLTVKSDSFNPGARGFEQIDLLADITITGDGGDNVIDFSGLSILPHGHQITYLDGAGGDDTITGSNLGDHVFGGTGDNTLSGLDGDDTLDVSASSGSNTLNGDAGNDTLIGGGGSDTLNGGAGDDTLIGGDGDTLNGGGGDDTLFGGAGALAQSSSRSANAIHFGGLNGGGAHVTLNGGQGNDIIHADQGGTYTVAAGAGDDTVFFDGTIDSPRQIKGGGGNDTLKLGGDLDLHGTSFNSALKGFESVKFLGDITINGDNNANIIDLSGFTVSAPHGFFLTVDGVGADDTITGSSLTDHIFGGAGDDSIDGGPAGDDVLDGGGGTDRVSFSTSATGVHVSLLAQGAAQDVGGGRMVSLNHFEDMAGSARNDALIGDNGDNRLDGGDGNDALSGGAGRDTLVGGRGADKFVFDDPSDSPAGVDNRDTIDFSHADHDRIDLSGIDADTTHNGDQAFHLVAGGNFTRSAGELIQVVDGSGHTIVMGDVNGDGIGDFEIQLTSAVTLVNGDFVF
jgi:Ca2+-binding RTX toxin-like protein